MARTPKAPPPPAPPARRGRKPKGAERLELAEATDNAAEDAQATAAEAVTVIPDNLLARGKRGRKPKQRPEAAAPVPPGGDEGQPSMDLDQTTAC